MNKDLPHSIEAEMGVLGSMFLDPIAIAEVSARIAEPYFHHPAHQTIFTEMLAKWTQGDPIDLITFTQHLRTKGVLETIGGAAYLTSVCTFVPSSAMLDYYLEIIRDQYILRQIIAASKVNTERAYEGEAGGLLEESISRLTNIGSIEEVRSPFIKEDIMTKMDRMEQGKPDEDIIKTRLSGLDHYSPLHDGDMPLITGERKMGKSILALSILENICLAGDMVGYFSLESRRPEVIDRLFAGISRIPSNLHHTSKMTPEQLIKASATSAKLADLPFLIWDDIQELTQIVGTMRQIKARHPKMRVFVVDYAQLVRAEKKNRNRQEEIAIISRTFRLTSMMLNTTIMVLSQLNKEGDSRESKALEMDTTANWKLVADEDEDPKMRLLEIPYQRNGESGVAFPVTFLGDIARVENAPRKGDLIIDKK